jgi:hypothetical protein
MTEQELDPVQLSDELLDGIAAAYHYGISADLVNEEKTRNAVIGHLLGHIRFLQEELRDVKRRLGNVKMWDEQMEKER